MVIVPMPSGIPSATNQTSSEMPATISGVTIGRYRSPSSRRRPGKRRRASARASRVPKTVARRVETAATIKLTLRPRHRSLRSPRRRYQSRVKPVQLTEYLEVLKLKSTSTSTGRCRKR